MANVLGKLLYVTEYYCSQIVELSSKPASGTNKADVSEFMNENLTCPFYMKVMGVPCEPSLGQNPTILFSMEN